MKISFSDVDKVSNMSAILVMPLIAAALYKEFGLWAFNNDTLWLTWSASSNPVVSILSSIFPFMVSVVIVSFCYIFLNGFLHQYKPLLFYTALSLLAFGLLGLENVVVSVGETIIDAKPSSHNMFWHLAALAWGFDIIKGAES